MPRGSLRPPLLLFLGLGVLAGCSESTVPLVGVYHPTLIQISPAYFLGDVPCRPNGTGALKTYVATLFDVGDATEDGEPFALPSTAPISCFQSVAFGRVDDPHRYRAQIDGYDRDDLLPLGSTSPSVTLGIPILVDPVTQARVPPRWTTTCGDQQSVRARAQYARTITQCEPLVDSMDLGPADVTVSIDAALGTLACGTEPGTVDHFEVGFGAGPVQSAPCGATVTLMDVPPNGTLPLSVSAYEAGAPGARWGSTCTANPVPNATVPATCSTLDDRGALDVVPADALTALGLDCSALGELRLELLDAKGEPVAPARFVEASGCNTPTRFNGITGGAASVLANLVVDAAELGSARCDGSVVPGRAVTATCSAEP